MSVGVTVSTGANGAVSTDNVSSFILMCSCAAAQSVSMMLISPDVTVMLAVSISISSQFLSSFPSESVSRTDSSAVTFLEQFNSMG